MRAPSELEGSPSSFAKQRQHVLPAPGQLVAHQPAKRIQFKTREREKEEEEEQDALKDARVSVMLQIA